MSKFRFVTESTITMSIEVEADTLEEAVAKASEASVMTLCHQCSHADAGEWGTSGELDCEPACDRLVGLHRDGDEVALASVDIPWDGPVGDDA